MLSPAGSRVWRVECSECRFCWCRNKECNGVFTVIGIRNKMTFTWYLARGWNKKELELYFTIFYGTNDDAN